MGATALWMPLLLFLSGVLSGFPRDFARHDSFPHPGEWPAYRRNGTLDAYSPLRGALSQPRIAWKQFVGATEHWFIVPGDSPASPAESPAQNAFDAATLSDPCWGLTAPPGEIEGRLQPLVQNATTLYAHVLPDTPGLQKIVFESAFSKPTKNGNWAHDCVGRCYAWRQGRWVVVWETEPIDALFSPQPIVGDFDGDGRQEIAILPWKELLIL